ncbi:hypothetical protein [Rhizobium sp. EC-SD404]|jgi:hypothetical protein|uniref:hypothetical protein n=1 Tax=Rhizobium sp. EC-SD404 TaxID=2038389 RepID=UPI001257C796|nr:hypothetical protein [Rhizobium sp. EC-SD404]VVT27703.1 conserved hypothetical protein [Rhizobium sp. EC-SD404]
MSVFPRTRTQWLLWTLIPAALAVFAAANIHLVYVAVTSQPDCVPHLKEAGGGETYRAAKSAC